MEYRERTASHGSWSFTRSVLIGGAMGLLLGTVGSVGGCQPDTAEAYNADLATAICEVRRHCPEIAISSMTGAVSFPDDATCEAAVLTQFESCGSVCKLRRSPARRCLRRLEAMASDCEGSIAPCRKAYRRCDTPNDISRCNLHKCTARVGVPNEEGLPWLLLLAVGWASRRRPRP